VRNRLYTPWPFFYGNLFLTSFLPSFPPSIRPGTGFTASQQGRNHSFTILLGCHPDLEEDCKTWVSKKTKKDKKFRLTVAKFGKWLNETLIPARADLESAFVNLKTKITPCISHAVAWRFMVSLGAKRGALQKGLVQDHERADVVLVRKLFVAMWILYMVRMFVYRRVDVAGAKKFMPVLQSGHAAPCAGNQSKFLQGLDLCKIKDEAPNDKEQDLMEKWADAHCSTGARTTL